MSDNKAKRHTLESVALGKPFDDRMLEHAHVFLLFESSPAFQESLSLVPNAKYDGSCMREYHVIAEVPMIYLLRGIGDRMPQTNIDIVFEYKSVFENTPKSKWVFPPIQTHILHAFFECDSRDMLISDGHHRTTAAFYANRDTALCVFPVYIKNMCDKTCALFLRTMIDKYDIKPTHILRKDVDTKLFSKDKDGWANYPSNL